MHDFHVCIMEIDHRPSENKLEISVKIFTDDLENTLEALGAPRLNIGGGKIEHPSTDSLIGLYLQHRIGLEQGTKRLPLTLVGKEVELDATWCYLTSDLNLDAKNLKIENRVLFERFEDQLNILYFRSPNGKQSFRMVASSPSIMVDF